MPLISVVIPVYKGEGCVAELCRRLKQAITTLKQDYEIILVDDRSPDNSWTAIQAEAASDRRVRGIQLARNFGQHRAITAGLDVAKGDWVVIMDCDLQDPPEEIPRLYAKALEGYEVVVAQFEERPETAFRQKISKAFWSGLGWLAGIPFDHRIGNFRIMSKLAVENFRCYREQLRLLGGITSLMGFTTSSVLMKRGDRFTGETSYTLRKLLAVALEIAMAYSDKPLKISVAIGLIISALAVIAGGVILLLGASGMVEVPGWASVMISLYLIGGIIIANLGVIGYYIGKTYDETKRRPLYIIERTTCELSSSPEKTRSRAQNGGNVFWITGLSGAGKSTLAIEVAKRFRAVGKAVVLLDGDELREVFGSTTPNPHNHGRDARINLALQYARLCQVFASQRLTVVIATISLFKEIHAWNRENLPGYFEIYLKVPLTELRRRDPKGIYHRFDSGELTNVAGVDLPVDEPESPDWVAEYTPEKSTEVLANEFMDYLNEKSVL